MSAASSSSGTLLLCVDLQPVFLRTIADAGRLSRRCRFAIAAAHGFEVPVVFSEQVPEKLGATDADLLALAPGASVFSKGTFSALADKKIREAVIEDECAEHLLLCGLETSVCVYQTAIDAIAADLQVTLLSDCVGARRDEDAQACLVALARAGVNVVPAETVFYAMLHDVKHPFFKAYTQLVKSHG